MAKSKNHTAHNQTSKAHRNGMPKPKLNKLRSQKGVYAKLRKNTKFARKHMNSTEEEEEA
eukprot:TRINITY_DN3294_c2_g1_i2.p2 TRINITY_DN3294_c2_g1~~TRINITY_DN3294_c2_g1_i2.p2  ORF type:complete len:69 (+),score=13.75 TRINITY_DN3294_c2_g1_i2:28-207(+)